MAETLLGRIRYHAQQEPKRESIRFLSPDRDDLVLSRVELVCAAEGAAEHLEMHGAQRGDLVLIILEDLPLLTTVFIGAIVLGAVPALLPFATEKLHPDRYQSSVTDLINIAKPVMLVTQERLRASVETILSAVGESAASLKLCVIPDVLQEPSAAFCPADGEVDPDEIALVQHSSGTTGLQKGVALTHRAILENIAAVAAPHTSDAVSITWLPMYHDLGLIANFLMPLVDGSRTVLIPTFYWLRSPQILFKAISEHGGTICWMPNFAFNFCAMRCRDADLEGVDLSSLQGIYNAGEPIYATSMDMFLARFQPYGLRPSAMIAGYGMAEVVLGISGTGVGNGPARVHHVDRSKLINDGLAQPVLSDDPRAQAIVSCGGPLPGVDVRIVDAANQPLADCVVGEVAVRCWYALRQYYNRPDLGDLLVDGWLNTGDIGYMQNGELYLIGRKKDFIIMGGKNIYPNDIETIISETEGVYPGRVAVFGVPNRATGTEDIAAIFELLPEFESSAQAVSDQVRREVARRSDVMVRHLWIRDHGWLIKSSSGKIARSANRQQLMSELGIANWLDWDGRS